MYSCGSYARFIVLYDVIDYDAVLRHSSLKRRLFRVFKKGARPTVLAVMALICDSDSDGELGTLLAAANPQPGIEISVRSEADSPQQALLTW